MAIKEAKTHYCTTCEERLPAMQTLKFKDKWYCPNCFQAKADREWFNEQIQLIFAGMPISWPRIQAERKRLMTNYGYTEKTIINTLKYALTEKKIPLRSESASLYLVTPLMVDEYTNKRRQLELEKKLANKFTTEGKKDDKIIFCYNDADHPINIPKKTNDSWDDLLLEDDE